MIRMADAGQPDILVGIKTEKGTHEIGFIECKLPKGRLSWVQFKTLREHHEKERRWCIATSLDEVDKFLNDKNYHGSNKFADEVIRGDKQFDTKSLDRRKAKLASKPNPYQSLIDQRNKKLEQREDELPPIPF